jgi:hypothetical protein
MYMLKAISTALQAPAVNGTTALLLLMYPIKTKCVMLMTLAICTAKITTGAKLVTVGTIVD